MALSGVIRSGTDGWPRLLSVLGPARNTAIEVYSWNPKRPLNLRFGRRRRSLNFRGSHRIPHRRINNFGDLLAPLLIEGMLDQLGLATCAPVRDARLMTIGSIHTEFRAGDVVWGSGVNGFFLDRLGSLELDVRAVRGPLSRRYLLDNGVKSVPEVYGDPAALLPTFRPDLISTESRSGSLFVPHFHESSGIYVPASSNCGPLPDGIRVQLPTRPVRECLTAICASQFVCASSLHAVIIAEACGIPARVVAPVHEPRFKYDDYYQGTGRTYQPASSIHEAVELGGQSPPVFDAQELINAFPVDLWRGPEIR